MGDVVNLLTDFNQIHDKKPIKDPKTEKTNSATKRAKPRKKEDNRETLAEIYTRLDYDHDEDYFNVVVTGAFPDHNRSQMIDRLADAGFEVSSKVNGDTAALFAGENNKASKSSKMKSAERLGIEIITPEQIKW